MNRAGGSAAFGRWAAKHIKTRVGAQLATTALGVLIFVDDYFNCLTVGSVMACDGQARRFEGEARLPHRRHGRTGLHHCPPSPLGPPPSPAMSRMARVSPLFIKSIPFNFYAWLTIIMMIGLAVMKIEYGPMAKFEANAKKGDLFSGKNPYAGMEEDVPEGRARSSTSRAAHNRPRILLRHGYALLRRFLHRHELRRRLLRLRHPGPHAGQRFRWCSPSSTTSAAAPWASRDIEQHTEGFKAMVPAILHPHLCLEPQGYDHTLSARRSLSTPRCAPRSELQGAAWPSSSS